MTDPDDLVFADEEDAGPAAEAGPPWRLLVVDDEEEIHSVSELALSGFQLRGRGLEFLHAYSAAEAREVLSREPGIGLVLLDVIMETDDAGLQLVRHIREELGDRFMRIILRTGQPGSAPERRIITEYDINDYKEKTELTANKLYSVVYTGFSSYDDMRELERTREELERKNEEIQRAFDDLHRFSHMASHDLQGPLRNISAFLDRLLLKQGDSLNEEVTRTLTRVSAAAMRLRRLVASMLELSRVDSRPLTLGAVPLAEVLDAVREANTDTLNNTQGRLIYDSESLPVLRSEPAFIHQLLNNLVENGLKYQAEGVVPEVTVEARRKDHAWEICVRDNGIGIDPKNHAKIFEEFERLHSNMEYQGSGIGLATCQRIVQRLGGSIRIESALGSGSAFIVTLPDIQAAEQS